MGAIPYKTNRSTSATTSLGASKIEKLDVFASNKWGPTLITNVLATPLYSPDLHIKQRDIDHGS